MRSFVLLLSVALAARVEGQTSPPTAEAAIQVDQRLITESKTGSGLFKNLTYIADIIGPRLTGTPAVKKANDWTAEKMKEYGLGDVRLEPWTLPEGWVRGHARGRILEPDNGRVLALSSLAWAPGTKGVVRAEVVIVNAKTIKGLAKYKGKLKDAAVLLGDPAKLKPYAEIEKIDDAVLPSGGPTPGAKKTQPQEEVVSFRKALHDFLVEEGAVALLQDAGKHFGLLFTTGNWGTSERPSAEHRMPTIFVAHDHYALLHRLASRPAPEKTRIELDVANEFVSGPIVSHNTIGEIKGSEKPDEFVIVGAHLDSWDLGQGALDNAGGSCVVLETARVLMKSGVAPKRTIRFILFTGEEQGLHGSKAYVKLHKEELAKTSACLVHDTGTGKVIGLGWHGRAELLPILEKELTSLGSLGVKQLHGRGVAGSDHYTFDKAGVPGCIFRQEVAGYRFGHHSQADTLEMVREADLIQGVQVMAVAAMRLANLESLLPRAKKEPRTE